MNILYLSHLSGASYAGPTYSVPKQIEAQSKIDNVFWYNAVKHPIDIWKGINYYHDLNDFPKESIKSLPEPFNHPDLIVVELFYNMFRSNLMRELLTSGIPYIIVPRGELTEKAQKRKRIKKFVANTIACRRYARKAAAIQYLTEQEFVDSGTKWNKNHIIVPNGIDLPNVVKNSFSTNGLQCVSIGRIEPYQKGLDLLIEASSLIKNELETNQCKIIICGPDKENQANNLKKLIVDNGLATIIEIRDGVYGEDKKELLLGSDVFLIPSRFEGHPMALIEALSYGLPCVATTGSNMRKEIDDYNAGWTCECNSEELKNALLKMLNDKHTFHTKMCQALELAQKYQWSILAELSHENYNSILK